MARSSGSAFQSRQTISSAQRSAPGELCVVAGRVLQLDAAAACLVLTDASGTLRVSLAELSHEQLPRAGDHVALRGRRSSQGLTASALELLTPYGRAVPFPSPGGEYHRLHAAQPSRARNLALRSRVLAATRDFFARRDYLEVQPPCRVRVPGLEPHLRAVPAGGRYLITSPEYQMKRLLAGGLERIYSMGPCWRGDEVGPHHLGEFCMLEWYRAYSTLDQLMLETEQLLAHVAGAVLGRTSLTYQGRALELAPPFERVTVAQAFARHAGVDLTAVGGSAAELRARAEAAGVGPLAPDASFEEVASRVLVERVEPALGGQRPVLLCDFPAPLAALAQLDPVDATVAQRFELYAGGLELANAFGELTDPLEQQRRLEQDQSARRAAGAEVHPLDRCFIEALREGIPPSAGIALGVDRLVMLICDAEHIDQVAAFAPDEV